MSQSPVTDHIVHSAHGRVVSMYHQLLVQFQTSEVLSWKGGGETSSLLFSTLFLSRLRNRLAGEEGDPGQREREKESEGKRKESTV